MGKTGYLVPIGILPEGQHKIRTLIYGVSTKPVNVRTYPLGSGSSSDWLYWKGKC